MRKVETKIPDESALKDVTLIVTADNKVGLYDNQGKEMK